MLSIIIPGIPISTNQSLCASHGRLVHTTKARDYRKHTEEAITKHLDKLGADYLAVMLEGWHEKQLTMEIQLHGSWFTRSGSIRHTDAGNREKLLVDSLFSALKERDPTIDDSQIFNINIVKINNTEEETHLLLKIS